MNLDQLVQSEFNVRKEYPGELTGELVDSIKLEGLFSKLVLRPVADGKYEVLAGWRRKLALEQIYDFNQEIPEDHYVLKDINDFEAVRVSIAENVQRVNLSSLELAGAVESLLEVNSKLKNKDLAKILWEPEARIKRLKKLKERVPELPTYAVEELKKPEELEPTITDAHIDAMVRAGGFDMGSEIVNDVCDMIMENELPASKVKDVVERCKPKAPESAPEPESPDSNDKKKDEDESLQDRFNGRLRFDDNGVLVVDSKKETVAVDLEHYKEYLENDEKFAVYINAKIDIKTIGE